MKCPNTSCGADNSLRATIVITREVPVGKGNSISLAGIGVTQKDLRDAWDQGDGKSTCTACGAEFVYEKGKGFQRVLPATQSEAPKVTPPAPATPKKVAAPVKSTFPAKPAVKKLVLKRK